MAILLGVDTGGTYTDAVLIDDTSDTVISKSKSLTTRPNLALGVGRVIDAVLAGSKVEVADIGLVSLSTTLATNALVEGQGGKVALVFVGFEEAELDRDGLREALAGDPVIFMAGGHDHSGTEKASPDLDALRQQLTGWPAGITGFAVAARFATRNPSHEKAIRDVIREATGKPVTCSHELSSALGGPKRALTAVLNARLIGMIDRLIQACETHLSGIGITARLMVVRGDGALISAELAKKRPIETILSGPAASIEGARWLTQETDALVSDIGGTTTDICLLRDGRPQIDSKGARVGKFRTMIEAVAMRTHGLGGDSEVHVEQGLRLGLRLGPRRIMPISLLALDHPELVHQPLSNAVNTEQPLVDGGRFVVPVWAGPVPEGLNKREAAIAERLLNGPQRLAHAAPSRVEAPALRRLVTRGLVIEAGVTTSDAAHVLGLVDTWDAAAARLALTIFARQRTGGGDRLAETPEAMAQMIIDQLATQTVDCLLQSAFAEDPFDFKLPVEDLSNHPLIHAGLRGHKGVVETKLNLAVPVIGLGASAGSYYGAVGDALGTRTILPEHSDVANAIGAVVGHVTIQAKGNLESAGAGRINAHLSAGPKGFADEATAVAALEAELKSKALADAEASGVDAPQIVVEIDRQTAMVENAEMFISATVSVTARGRPRIAN